MASLTMHSWFVLVAVLTSCLLTSVYSAPPICGRGISYHPEPTDCSEYYVCAYNRAKRLKCPASLEFSATTKKCELPAVANCGKMCDALVSDAKGTWDPPSCSAGQVKVGISCSIKCAPKFELRGSSSVVCTDFGWNSTNGNFIPKCEELECFSQAMKDTMNATLSVKSGMLFVLDESGSIGHADYIKSKEFVKDIVSAFPLSSSRTAGLITFSDDPIVRIRLSEASTYNFNRAMDSVPYRSRGTDVLEALERAYIEIDTYHRGKSYVVILITDGISDTDATPAANNLKKGNHPVFAIGVGKTRLAYVESLSSMGENGIRHFFHTRDFDILKSIGSYMNRPASASAATRQKCP